jgi:diguanylate cyclase (GGDEF)-like protein
VGRSYRRLLLFAAAWSALVLLAYRLEIGHQDRMVNEVALSQARALFQQASDTREWNAAREGVYVEVSEEVAPSPHLAVADRDVVTSDGVHLTKVHHARMTREIGEIGESQRGWVVHIHVTSLKPLRPGNRPTAWEAAALREFEQGASARFGFFVDDEKRSQFRYMEPVLVEASCLECHGHQGYEVGDVRGGLSVTFPVAALVRSQALARQELRLGFIFVWLSGLGIMASVAYSFEQKRRLVGKLRDLALVSELTGLHNRRGFLTVAQKQLESARREGKHALLMFFDVNGLKQINDTYGHDEGDNALKLAGQALKSTFRGSDVVARFGGDEFVALLPGCPGRFAELVLERLRARTEAIGVGSRRPYRLSLCELVDEADRRMYRAKRVLPRQRGGGLVSEPSVRMAVAGKRTDFRPAR